ncbi:hypothetical protein B0H17DRAFT_1131551 [Mycena rosella]|uniref:BTB domain-containing protein n=1 Tax=Mycena rosella TaxID=1033263 RepID=A0AAD7DMM5_MYCRO|nr:hypothetical protein B0H17DRAFT_1131551 [Mycena rosella]
MNSTMNYPGLWFEDGDIVLSANPHVGDARRLFLVHKHTLSSYSPVFWNIFNEPSGVRAEDVDGIQAKNDVELLQVNDPASDLAELLQCLYYPTQMPFNFKEPTVNIDMGGLLRLCKKYDIADLAARVVNQLKFEWPTSLAIYEQHEARVRMLGLAHADAPGGQIDEKYLDDRFPEPASIVALAREFDIPELLPAAFYALSLISPRAKYDMYHSPIARQHPECAARLAMLTRSARWSLLAPADLLRLARGQDQLRSPTALTKMFEGRTRSADCSAGCDALLVALRRLAGDTHDILGALTYLRIYITEPDRAPKMKICRTCAAATCGVVATLRLRIWSSLPLWFGVPGVRWHQSNQNWPADQVR